MSYIEREISLIVSSDKDVGAKNISTDGSSFSLNFGGDGINLPRSAQNVTVAVESASVWWNIGNIKAGVNDKLYIKGPNTSNIATDFEITIAPGLYDLDELEQAIHRELENKGAWTTDAPIIELNPDEATQKVEIKVNYPVVEIDFTQPNTMREILGFNSVVLTAPVAPYTHVANNVAEFNSIEYFLIHTDLVSQGIRYNGSYNQTVAQVLIDVPAGSQIVSQPFNPPKIQAPELRTKSDLRFWITDHKNRAIDTNGEVWGCRVSIRYLEWLEAPK